MSRALKLTVIAGGVVVVSGGLWLAGHAWSVPLLHFAGLMVGATTFVPLPADTFVLAASREIDAWTIGLLGAGINTVMVFVERRWILILVGHPAFDRVAKFFDNNRVVALANRNMFLGLLIGGAFFIPFEPFRLVAVMRDYSLVRYGIATFLARGGRYYVLAAVGSALIELGALQEVIWLSLALFGFGLWRTGTKILKSSSAR